MVTVLELSEKPQAEKMVMIVGWRQWADAGSISSGLPQYLIDQMQARHIGKINADGFYFFQLPGTHDLLRPIVRFVDGYPQELKMPQNDFYYAEVDKTGVVIFLGDEPHLGVEGYIGAILEVAQTLNVTQMIGVGGVYAEVPYNKERNISSTCSNPALRGLLKKLAVTTSNYHGGASINTILCRRSADCDMDYVSFYGFVPNYDLSRFQPLDNALRLENDFTAWLGIMRRICYYLQLEIDLNDLEDRSKQLVRVLDDKIAQLEAQAPASGIREYFNKLSKLFAEVTFDMPLADVWEDELRRLLDDNDSDDL